MSVTDRRTNCLAATTSVSAVRPTIAIAIAVAVAIVAIAVSAVIVVVIAIAVAIAVAVAVAVATIIVIVAMAVLRGHCDLSEVVAATLALGCGHVAPDPHQDLGNVR